MRTPWQEYGVVAGSWWWAPAICYCKDQIHHVHLSRVTDNEFPHNIVKVVYGSPGLGGLLQKNWVVACSPLPKALTLFKTKIWVRIAWVSKFWSPFWNEFAFKMIPRFRNKSISNTPFLINFISKSQPVGLKSYFPFLVDLHVQVRPWFFYANQQPDCFNFKQKIKPWSSTKYSIYHLIKLSWKFLLKRSYNYIYINGQMNQNLDIFCLWAQCVQQV